MSSFQAPFVILFSMLTLPGLAFVRTPFLSEQVRIHASLAPRSTTCTSISTRMVAAPEEISTGVKRNEHFAKLKVRWLIGLGRELRYLDNAMKTEIG